jgi:hypothetical protein
MEEKKNEEPQYRAVNPKKGWKVIALGLFGFTIL